ncbi:nitrite reductase large subunit NirB [Roseiterribacter gracilis]|uniref:Nitrite reductase large subunit n=1 Tax=Roseiterribacter gracilis TaxID=2812848 RepID=A0A8S8XJI7_9PROT|nr:nitrite reductase large subunit [Rhodospirillales bacterium TMPK1]
MGKERLVLVGNGMAGMRTIEEILTRAPDRFDITVFGAEPHGNYDRIMLSPLLAGEKSFADITLQDRAWYEERKIELITSEAVVAIDRDARTVTGAHGTLRGWDRLLLATGSNPFVPPVPGVNLPGVCTFRDKADVDTMLDAARKGGKAIVIGGGLLGLEAANGLALNGMDITVLHLMPSLMERQLDGDAAALLAADLQRRGIKILTQAETVALTGDAHVTGVQLKDGTHLPADLVVMAVGIRPNASLAKDSGLEVKRGVLIDDGCTTSDPGIFAVGECVEHRGVTYGLVAPIWDMAKVCADRITGADKEKCFAPVASATRLKVTGIEMLSLGDFSGGDGTEDLVFRDPGRGVYRRIVLRDDKVIGAVLYGDARDGGWYQRLLRDGSDCSAFRDALVFGEAFAGEVKQPATALPDDAEICGCNGVSKGAICSAIAKHGLTDIDGVRKRTKASASCGSCTEQVEAILVATVGDAFQKQTGVKPMCPCTDHPHEEVRRRIAAEHLTNMADVMRTMGWRTQDGCASCRPALNFYLLCAWPKDYADDPQSRFVNERDHANIQKDGTYSVIPRIWGGVTNAAELRAIADVVDKYAIPEVKITGGQRIDLLGVPKEQLTSVWRDLNAAGLVSGHAYGKALRTVKTCVGSTWCRFGTQDSTTMGIELERMTWGSWHPHKVKLAVSGCPRNCAEATIKDLGVVAVDSGWELHVGGNGGIKVRVTDLLCKVTTSEEVLEYTGAFLQLYREEARYLDRTAPWIERVGIDYVKQRIVADAAGRKELYERFLESQRILQHDPWAAQVETPDADFAPLHVVESLAEAAE